MSLVQLLFRSYKTKYFSDEAFLMESGPITERNRTLGITGLLIAQNNTFTGLLEGQEETLLNMMERIICDRRHRHVAVLLEQNIEQRRFAAWKYCAIDKPEPCEKVPSLGDLLRNELSIASVVGPRNLQNQQGVYTLKVDR